MISFPENIINFNLISVMEFHWGSLDMWAAPRPHHALSFRISGDCVYTAHNEKTIICSDDILFVPANLGYHQKRKSEHLFCILFSADNMPSDGLCKFTPINPKTFEGLFASMYECWTRKRPGHIAEATSYFYRIISKIQSQQAERQSSVFHNTLNDALEFIHENFTDPGLTVGAVSEVASVSESYFRKQFRELTGVSPIRYINNLRSDYAVELINTNYYKIYEIAEMAGFSDAKYFSTVIKQKTGYSPKTLANQNLRRRENQ